MEAARRLPVVVVLGTTGAGKSKLAIALGRHFGGEIISADSMQLYEGLDVITNKVTMEERHQCRHHLLSVLHPLSANNTVTNFRDMALPIVECLLSENKLPVIVGGTNYYIESIMWNFLIDRQTVDLVHQANVNNSSPHLARNDHHCIPSDKPEHPPLQQLQPQQDKHTQTPLQPQQQFNPNVPAATGTVNSTGACKGSEEKILTCLDASSDESDDQNSSLPKSSSRAKRDKEGRYADFDSVHLHSWLQKVDPESAKRLHPKNRRRVVRALQVYDNYGVPMSSILKAQHSNSHTPGLSGGLRYPHCCVLWVQSDQTVLDERLDKRVDDMLQQGLVSELHDLHTQYLDSVAARSGDPDYTLGIFQSIGFKEFHEYLEMPQEKRDMPEGKEIFNKGVEALKLATRQYARRQLKWIRNRFLNRPGPHVPDVYGLDTTEPSQWTEKVLKPAICIVSAIIQGEKPAIPPLSHEGKSTVYVHNICHTCEGRVFVTLTEWTEHLRSRKHKKMLERQRSKAKAEAADVDS